MSNSSESSQNWAINKAHRAKPTKFQPRSIFSAQHFIMPFTSNTLHKYCAEGPWRLDLTYNSNQYRIRSTVDPISLNVRFKYTELTICQYLFGSSTKIFHYGTI